MGKKSRRKGNNKPSPCYHGCTKQEFNNCGEHYKVLESDDKAKTDEERIEIYETHKRVIENPTFGNFVAAHVTDDFLKGKNNTLLKNRLHLLLSMRYASIPKNEGKDVGHESKIFTNYNKYARDIQTERGRINCMAREIPCDCMEAKRIEAQAMDRVSCCYGCNEEFPKKKMLRCEGCNFVQYCSKECSIKDWPEHKEWCKRNSVSSASASTPGSLPSFEESTDVDAGEE